MNVIYEDNHLLVVEKPYGVPSQADASGDTDMLSLCRAYIGEKYAKPGKVYIGLLHRLDRPTSGVMVFARTSKAASRISAQIRAGTFKKTYLAVLTAAPPKQRGELWHHMCKDSAARTAHIADAHTPGAKKAKLKYETLGNSGGLYLVRIELLTGRFHQIRAQFAAAGAPVYGDQKYGPRSIKAQLALFAQQISFDHPVTKQRLCFYAKPVFHPFALFDI